MSWFPPRLLPNAIFCPSGDHAGVMSSAGLLLRFVRAVPSGFMLQTSPGCRIGSPSPGSLTYCARVNAMRLPSGRHAGELSVYGEPGERTDSGLVGAPATSFTMINP